MRAPGTLYGTCKKRARRVERVFGHIGHMGHTGSRLRTLFVIRDSLDRSLNLGGQHQRSKGRVVSLGVLFFIMDASLHRTCSTGTEMQRSITQGLLTAHPARWQGSELILTGRIHNQWYNSQPMFKDTPRKRNARFVCTHAAAP